jgi:hypothetical protein
MHQRVQVTFGLGLALALAFLFLPADALAGRRQDRGEDTPLGAKMGEINGQVKQLEGLLGDEPKWEEALAGTCALQQLALEAKAFDPASIADIEDEKELRKARVEFRAQMQALVDALFELELAILEESEKKADKAYRGLDKVKSTGHGKFK